MLRFLTLFAAAASLSACATLRGGVQRQYHLSGDYSRLSACAYRVLSNETTAVTHSEMAAERTSVIRMSSGEVVSYEAYFVSDGPNKTRLNVTSMPTIQGEDAYPAKVRAAALTCG